MSRLRRNENRAAKSYPVYSQMAKSSGETKEQLESVDTGMVPNIQIKTEIQDDDETMDTSMPDITVETHESIEELRRMLKLPVTQKMPLTIKSEESFLDSTSLHNNDMKREHVLKSPMVEISPENSTESEMGSNKRTGSTSILSCNVSQLPTTLNLNKGSSSQNLGRKRGVLKEKIRRKCNHVERRKRTKSECRKRWESIRDHYKRQGKEEGSTGSASQKKRRANYWDMLKFLDTVEDERDSFANDIAENIQDNAERTSTETNDLSSNTDDCCSSLNLNLTPSCQPEKTSQSADFQTPPSKRRRENSAIYKYLMGKKDERADLNKCINELMKPEEQDEIDLFFKSMAVTVKKFRRELVTQTEMKIFQIVTDMDTLNQQSEESNLYPCRSPE